LAISDLLLETRLVALRKHALGTATPQITARRRQGKRADAAKAPAGKIKAQWGQAWAVEIAV
jgi:hypothetical protein